MEAEGETVEVRINYNTHVVWGGGGTQTTSKNRSRLQLLESEEQ